MKLIDFDKLTIPKKKVVKHPDCITDELQNFECTLRTRMIAKGKKTFSERSSSPTDETTFDKTDKHEPLPLLRYETNRKLGTHNIPF